MKIAAITITYNDSYKFYEWCEHYEQYKDDIYLHIIIDNNSNIDYINKVKRHFKNSVIIQMGHNGGCTESYNVGIKYALNDINIDSIALIGNDIMIKQGDLIKLHKFLFSNHKYGMVEPIILENDGKINEFGCSISKILTLQPYFSGRSLKDVNDLFHICDAVTGGMNLSKRIFYEQIGLQDENLFMYSDEVDIGIRAKNKGFYLASFSGAQAWHMHINENNNSNRHLFSNYLIARNKVYLGYKHFGKIKAYIIFLFFFMSSLNGFFKSIFNSKEKYYKKSVWQMFGALAGLFKNMQQNRYSSL